MKNNNMKKVFLAILMGVMVTSGIQWVSNKVADVKEQHFGDPFKRADFENNIRNVFNLSADTTCTENSRVKSFGGEGTYNIVETK
jgi:hypothetical protein